MFAIQEFIDTVCVGAIAWHLRGEPTDHEAALYYVIQNNIRALKNDGNVRNMRRSLEEAIHNVRRN